MLYDLFRNAYSSHARFTDTSGSLGSDGRFEPNVFGKVYLYMFDDMILLIGNYYNILRCWGFIFPSLSGDAAIPMDPARYVFILPDFTESLIIAY